MPDNIDFQFLGEQIKRLHGGVRDVKARLLLIEHDQGELRQDFSRLETKVDAFIEVTDDRFDRLGERFVEMFRLLNQEFASLKRGITALKPS